MTLTPSRLVRAVRANWTAWTHWNSEIERARREYALHPDSTCWGVCPCRRADAEKESKP